MELGIILHMDFGPEVSPQQAWEDVEAQVRLAKEAGFDWVWTATEIGWRRFDALSSVVAVAALRTGLGVGSAVIILPLYNPVHVAQTFALVDILTGGQCVLGVGQGVAGGGVRRCRSGLPPPLLPLCGGGTGHKEAVAG
jgi:alkanesulfonate monooxygenase SsuD/methylene tetrahydromethanopterin reductase-like flavin-dependent oxidoreductase (luciferase family)